MTLDLILNPPAYCASDGGFRLITATHLLNTHDFPWTSQGHYSRIGS